METQRNRAPSRSLPRKPLRGSAFRRAKGAPERSSLHGDAAKPRPSLSLQRKPLRGSASRRAKGAPGRSGFHGDAAKPRRPRSLPRKPLKDSASRRAKGAPGRSGFHGDAAKPRRPPLPPRGGRRQAAFFEGGPGGNLLSPERRFPPGHNTPSITGAITFAMRYMPRSLGWVQSLVQAARSSSPKRVWPSMK